jgi:hypothetical protein
MAGNQDHIEPPVLRKLSSYVKLLPLLRFFKALPQNLLLQFTLRKRRHAARHCEQLSGQRPAFRITFQNPHILIKRQKAHQILPDLRQMIQIRVRCPLFDDARIICLTILFYGLIQFLQNFCILHTVPPHPSAV